MKIPSSRGKSSRSSSSSLESEEPSLTGSEVDPYAMYVSFEHIPSSEGWYRAMTRRVTDGPPVRSCRPSLPYELPISKFYNNYESAGEKKAREESLSDILSLSASLEGILAGDECGYGLSKRVLAERMDDFVAGSVDSVLLDCLEDELPSVEIQETPFEVAEVLSLTPAPERRTTRATAAVPPRAKRQSALKATAGAFSYKEPDSDIEEDDEDLLVPFRRAPKRRKSRRKRR